MAIPGLDLALIEHAFLDSARNHCPVRTGATRDSFSVRQSATPESVTMTLWGSPVALFIVSGTAAHDIYPRHAGALHWQDGGGDHFAAHVRHPGTRPNNFFQPVVDEMRPLLIQAGNSALESAAEILARRFR